MKKIECHVHTIASKDSIQTKYPMLLMCKLKKIDCLAITDHNEIWYAQKHKNFFKKHNIDIIIGEEIFTSEGEIIGLFLTKKIEPGLTAKETIKLIKEQGGMVYIPHPYDPNREKTVLDRKIIEENIKKIDFIEGHNGRNICTKTSEKQLEIVSDLSARMINGSDAHTFYELGRNFCYIDSYEKEHFIRNIEKANFHKSKCIKLAHINTKIVKILKMITKGDINGIIRIIKRKIKKRK